jgi:hypothetical protein
MYIKINPVKLLTGAALIDTMGQVPVETASPINFLASNGKPKVFLRFQTSTA